VTLPLASFWRWPAVVPSMSTRRRQSWWESFRGE
jgi:hypothetical protein